MPPTPFVLSLSKDALQDQESWFDRLTTNVELIPFRPELVE